MEVDHQTPVEAGTLDAFVRTIFERCGMEPPDAATLAGSLVDADLRGIHSHGVLRVPEYVARLTEGGVDPRGRPDVVRDSGACLLVDGGNSMGVIGAQFAMRAALERAATLGLAVAAIRGSNHCGALAYLACQALERDMIGIVTTNALPTMAPWGGAERILGINPLAVAIPAGAEWPIVYDAAFSGSSHGKIRVYRNQGRTLPEGWALDSQGHPTTDAAAALDGLLLPIGGFKGSGLAVIMGILSSMLSGAAYGTELGSMETGARAGQDGHFVVALRVGAFVDVAEFKERVDAAIRQIHDCRRAPGVERIYAPGELEWLTREAYRRDGIPLDAPTLSGLQEAARRVGLEPRVLEPPGGGR
jgi:LDH2 family malate/lactate/ureidoglycolate dehydrogenase